MDQDIQIIKAIATKNGITELGQLKRYNSGINNRVYSLNDAYVVKLEGDPDFLKGILGFQQGLTDKLLSSGAKVPRILDCGDIDGKAYLLMEKLKGANLVYSWLKFSMAEKENFIFQLAEQIKIVHSIKYDNYSIHITEQKPFSNLKDAVQRIVNFGLIDKNKLKPEHAREVEYLEQFYADNIHLLDEQNSAVLVHDDLNLENIFFEGNKITGIIDWDWACQAPKDYELWKITEVFHEPKYSVEERLEPLYQNYKMTEEFGFLRKAYPDLFNVNHIADRIRLYYLTKIVDTIADYQKGKWSEGAMVKVQSEIDDFYKNGWLDRLVE